MKVTIYELLGMVKNGKAPKKIKYDNYIFEYYDGIYYMTEHNTVLDEYCDLSKVLNDEVEIVEEEKKMPEKLDWNKNDFTYPEGNLMSEETADMLMEIQDKVNFILEYLKSKGE